MVPEFHDDSKPPLKKVNHELKSALIERWHPKISSSHLPFVEMAIALDDVSNLRHMPVTGSFFSPPGSFNADIAIQVGMELLGIPHLDCVVEANKTREPYFRFSFLVNAYTVRTHANG